MNEFNSSLAVLLTLIFTLPASAQVKLGIIGGLNIANLKCENQMGFRSWAASRFHSAANKSFRVLHILKSIPVPIPLLRFYNKENWDTFGC